MFISWGWNRANYSRSDIHFKGRDYNFTLKKVTATDKPTGFDPAIHFNPLKLTIPQTNFKMGYFLNDHYSISFAFDHMKYVMQQDQRVKMSGTIMQSGTEYDGIYNNDEVTLTRDFLEYENTDGLNYVHAGITRHDRIFKRAYGKKTEIISLYSVAGASAGGMYPRTDSHLLNYRRNNQFHLAGYGMSIHSGLRLELFSCFFFQSEAKVGYINMPSIRPTEIHSEKAKQHFSFFQHNLLFGFSFRIAKPAPAAPVE